MKAVIRGMAHTHLQPGARIFPEKLTYFALESKILAIERKIPRPNRNKKKNTILSAGIADFILQEECYNAASNFTGEDVFPTI